MELIDKSVVIAKINLLQDSTMDEDGNFYSVKAQAEYDILCELEEYLDTLEVKEINSTDTLIKKFEDYLNSQLYDWVSITNPDQRSCANVIPKKDFIEDFKNYMKGNKL